VSTQELYISALRSVGISEGDLVFGHFNLGLFGIPLGLSSREDIANFYIHGLETIVGPEGGIAAPAYSYSFSNNEQFSITSTKFEGGPFSLALFKHKNMHRTYDPFCSLVGIGSRFQTLADDLNISPYENNGIFQKLLSERAKVITMNLHAGSTFIHLPEKHANSACRFDKLFEGECIDTHGTISKHRASLYVRFRHPATAPNYLAYDALAKAAGIVKIADFGRGHITVQNITDMYQVALSACAENGWVFTQAGSAANAPQKRELLTLT
jgi:aminoglycoside N3'-acetyltransferase